jgi:multiple sugar transport system substrate-binding protein
MRRRDFLLKTTAAVALADAPLSMPALAQAQKTVTLWHIYNNESDMIHLGIKKFNGAQNGYQIEQRLVPYTQINPELVRAIATGSPPDLVVINDPDLASYASQGQFTDLTDRVAGSKVIDESKYYKGPQTSDHWKGRRYSVAREVNTLGLYYNIDMFKAKGLDPNKPPTTWKEMVEAAEKLTDPGKHVFGLGFCAAQSEQSTFQWLPFLWQAGGSIDKLDQPEAAAALELWADLVRRQITSRDVINQPQAEVTNTFFAQGSAMAVGGPWELPRFRTEAKFEWGVALLPVKDDRNIHASSLGGFHFAIPKGAKEADGAFKVIEAMSDPALFREGWNFGGLLAPRNDIEIADPAWPKAYAVFREQMKTAIQRGPHPQWAQLSRPIQTAIQEALTGAKPAAQALQEAAAKIQPVLAKTPL